MRHNQKIGFMIQRNASHSFLVIYFGKVMFGFDLEERQKNTYTSPLNVWNRFSCNKTVIFRVELQIDWNCSIYSNVMDKMAQFHIQSISNSGSVTLSFVCVFFLPWTASGQSQRCDKKWLWCCDCSKILITELAQTHINESDHECPLYGTVGWLVCAQSSADWMSQKKQQRQHSHFFFSVSVSLADSQICPTFSFSRHTNCAIHHKQEMCKVK